MQSRARPYETETLITEAQLSRCCSYGRVRVQTSLKQDPCNQISYLSSKFASSILTAQLSTFSIKSFTSKLH
jgi:hypothetical protein